MNFDFVCRFQDRNCGRRNARACAARKVESVKPPSCSTAPKPTPESLESARLINEGFNHGPAPESCTRGIDTFLMSVCRWWRKRRWSACAALARPWKRAPSCRRKLLVMLMKDPTRSSCKDGWRISPVGVALPVHWILMDWPSVWLFWLRLLFLFWHLLEMAFRLASRIYQDLVKILLNVWWIMGIFVFCFV